MCVGELVIGGDDPRVPEVQELLDAHLAVSRALTPSEHVHSLDVEGLLDPGVTFYSARRAGELLGVGALRELEAGHGELKSMHTKAAARRQGVGRAMVAHLLSEARARGYNRVSLETGTGDGFAAAYALYLSVGFQPCPPFGQYSDNPHSRCMTMQLDEKEAQS